MYAIVTINGQQFKVEEGKKIFVQHIKDAEAGQSVEFDKVLLDAPCSGSGTENVFKKNFTKELIEKSSKTQEILLRKALKILKPGGEMIYSTCSILKDENENILEKVLKSTNANLSKLVVKDQDGAVKTGIQTGENPFPYHCYCCGRTDFAFNSTSCRYADAG